MVQDNVEDIFYKLGWRALPFRRSKYSCPSFVNELGSEHAEPLAAVKAHFVKMRGEEARLSLRRYIYKHMIRAVPLPSCAPPKVLFSMLMPTESW